MILSIDVGAYRRGLYILEIRGGGWREKLKGGNGKRGVGDFEMKFRWCLKNVGVISVCSQWELNNSIVEGKKACPV